MITRELAWEIAEEFAREIGSRWGEHIVAVLVVGSLASGAYHAGRSDIDTVVVLRDDAPLCVDEGIREVRTRVEVTRDVPKGFGAIVVRLRELTPPYVDYELVPEILRMKQQGVQIWGDLDVARIPAPSKGEITTYVQRFAAWLRAEYIDRRPVESRTVDATVNTAQYELRAWLWHVLGEYVLDKDAVVARAMTVESAARVRPALRRINRYLKEGREFSDVEDAEKVLGEISKFVRVETAEF